MTHINAYRAEVTAAKTKFNAAKAELEHAEAQLREKELELGIVAPEVTEEETKAAEKPVKKGKK